jgi:hypothetical protein
MKPFVERLALLSGKLRIHLVPFISSDIGTERSAHESLTLQGWREGAEETRPWTLERKKRFHGLAYFN